MVVEEHGWATEEELMDYYAIGQCTPGVNAVNVSTFIGHTLRGLPGAIVATLGFISPTNLINTLIAASKRALPAKHTWPTPWRASGSACAC